MSSFPCCHVHVQMYVMVEWAKPPFELYFCTTVDQACIYASFYWSMRISHMRSDSNKSGPQIFAGALTPFFTFSISSQCFKALLLVSPQSIVYFLELISSVSSSYLPVQDNQSVLLFTYRYHKCEHKKYKSEPDFHLSEVCIIMFQLQLKR